VPRAAVLLLSASYLIADSQTDALYHAARTGDLEKVEMLLAAGVSPRTPEPGGNTPLHAAALSGRLDIARRLIEAGAEVDARHTQDRATPLHYAITGDHAAMLEFLLARGADPSAVYGDLVSGLHLAAGRGHARIVEILIAKGAALNSRAGNGATPLEDAVRRGSEDVVRLLLDAGVDAGIVNSRSGQTALHVAAGINQRGIAAMLIDAGSALHVIDRNGATPLDVALQYQRRDLVNLLLDRGAKYDVAGALRSAVLRGQMQMLRLLADRITPGLAGALLSDAAVKGHGEIVTFLLENKADVNGRNADGATPLHDAALGGGREVAALLLKRGAQIDARDRDSEATPLHVAASWGRRAVVELLLVSGADPWATDKNGRTPLDLAIANQQNEIAEILRRMRPLARGR
jgi:ankyrin repeat protein